MIVIHSLCVSLGNSTIHGLGSRQAYSEAGFSSQTVDRAWGYTTEEQRSVVRFLWVKGPNSKDIYKEMFLVYGGKCLSGKAVHNWVENVSLLMSLKRRCGVAETVKALLCCGFRRTGKAMGQVYQCWWRICREINVSSRFEYHIFYVIYLLVTCLLTLPRTYSLLLVGTLNLTISRRTGRIGKEGKTRLVRIE
jgi:hypothetical protein